MAIKNYDDITEQSEQTITSADQAEDAITHLDLRREAAAALAGGQSSAVVLHAGAYNSEGIEVLYLPDAGRAGVAWGADADWTDADSAADALERYFGVNGKEMVN